MRTKVRGIISKMPSGSPSIFSLTDCTAKAKLTVSWDEEEEAARSPL